MRADFRCVKMNHLKFCRERSELLDAMVSASNEYARAAMELPANLPGARLNSATLSDIAGKRAASKEANEMYLNHRREHGC